MTEPDQDSPESDGPPPAPMGDAAGADDLERALADSLGGEQDIDATLPVGASSLRQFADLLVARALQVDPPENYALHTGEFDITGVVPRTEPWDGPFTSTDIFIRLENKVYGPLDRDHLNQLLGSGMLTGYESSTVDFVRWTPLAYHPRMVLAESVDPDLTHDLLSGISDLPASSGKSAMARAEAFLDSDEPPLAAIVVRPNRRKKTDVELPLPVVGDLDKETIEDVFRRVSGDHEAVDHGIGPEADTPDLDQEVTPELDAADVSTPELDAAGSPTPTEPTASMPDEEQAKTGSPAPIVIAIAIVVAVVAYFLFLR